jgi:hypothetical protein
VLAEIDAEDAFELASIKDQRSVEPLPSNGADAPLDVRVRVRRLDRRSDRPPALLKTRSNAQPNFSAGADADPELGQLADDPQVAVGCQNSRSAWNFRLSRRANLFLTPHTVSRNADLSEPAHAHQEQRRG